MTSTSAYFLPAADLLPYWPHDLLAPSAIPGLGSVAQRIGVTALDVVEYDGYLTMTGTLAVWHEIEFALPGFDALSLVLGQIGGGLTRVPFELRFGQASGLGDAANAVEAALTLFLKGYLPPYELVLTDLDVRLRVSRRYLKPMAPNDPADPRAGFHEAPGDAHCEFVVRGTVLVNTETGLSAHGYDRVDLDYAQIGSTGIVIRAEDVLLRLSDGDPPPNIDPQGFDLPENWKGVYFKELTAYNLPALWEPLPDSLELRDWYLGTGGVTGKATAVFDLAPDMSERTIALRTLQLKLEQNNLTLAHAQVALKVAFFDDAVLWLDVAITNDPELDFPQSVGLMGAVSLAQPPDAPSREADEVASLPLSAGGTEFLRLGATKLGLRSTPDRARASDQGRPEDTRFFDLLLDGHVLLLPASGVGDAAAGAHFRDLGLQLRPGFKFLVPGGLWISLSEEIRSKVAAFPLAIGRVGFGSEGDERWVGLDARVTLGGDAVSGSVKGLRIHFGGSAGTRLSFEGIEVRVAREPAFSLYGFLAMTTAADPAGMADSGTTFRGGVQLQIGALGLTVEGHVLFGTKGGTTFWYVALDGGFDPGLPLAPSMSLFGLALLLGNHVTPNRQLSGDRGDSFNWYRDWYRPAPGPYSVMHSAKWQPAADRRAVGAGASIGSPDGVTWSVKAFLAILLPGPVIILEGRARFLTNREAHSGPPSSDLIRALMVLDFDSDQFLLALEVDHRVPGSGLLYDLHAEGEVFVARGRPGDWHLAVGWYEPISRRVRATGLKLFNWDFYFIISGRDLAISDRTLHGIAAAVGYRNGFDKRWKFGPVRVVAAAWFSIDVAVSAKPAYVLGMMRLVGELAVKLYGFGIELGLDARLALEAPVDDSDLTLSGEVQVRVGTPWPLPDVKLEIPITFGDAGGMPPPVDPLVDGASVTPGYSTQSAAVFRRGQDVPTPARLPLDGRLVVDFARPMRSSWSRAPTPVHVARPDQVGDVYYRYTVTDVRVQVVPAGGGAAHPPVERLFGQWTLAAGDDGPQASSLILWGSSPFPFAGSLTWPGRTVRRTWEDILFDYHATYPCGDGPEPPRCITFEGYPPGRYEPHLRHQPDPLLPAVIFSAAPTGQDLEAMRVTHGQVVQTPIAVRGDDEACLALSRTAALGYRDEPDGGPAVRPVHQVWGVGVDLPATVVVTGEVAFLAGRCQLRVRARRVGTVVAELATTEQTFELEVEEGNAFDRLELLVEPLADLGTLLPSEEPCLRRLCLTTLGMRQREHETVELQAHWRHVFDPLVEEDPPPGTWFGAHLIHEPGATYHVHIDVRTDQAPSVDGPWHEPSTRTETVTATVGGAPDDLSPYVAAVVPGHGARPFYADYDLRITYNRQYVEALYDVAGEPLRVELVDALGRPVEPVPERGRTEEPGLPPDVEQFLERIVDTACVSVDLGRIPGYDETRYQTRLATSTAYEVRVHGGGHVEPLYRWSFTTSRYRDFADHLSTRRPVAWSVAVPATGDWSALSAWLADPPVERAAEEAAFHAAIAALGLRLHTLPARTEATLLWDTTAPAVRGVLLASDEPLLVDRVTVRLLDPEGAPIPHVLLRSRDGARALLIPAAPGPAPDPGVLAGVHELELRYRLYAPGQVRLTRQGSTSDEVVRWALPVPEAPVDLVDAEA